MVRLCLEAGEEGRKTVFRNGFPRRLWSHVDMRVKRRAPAFTEADLSALWPSSAEDTIKVLVVRFRERSHNENEMGIPQGNNIHQVT